MNEELLRLARSLGLDRAEQPLGRAFGVACAARVRHLLVDERAVAALDTAVHYVAGEATEADFRAAAASAREVAQSHPGSGMIDGSGNAAVSATTGLDRALNGSALDAAGYCAYAAVYAYSSSSVTDPRAYEQEHRWQVETLRRLSEPLTEAEPGTDR